MRNSAQAPHRSQSKQSKLSTAAPQLPPPPTQASLRARAAEVFFIWAIFFIHAAWPVPDVNEPHYLPKAQRAWNVDYLPHDPFLNSPNAHCTFNMTTGWLTRFCALDTYAWIGRLATWLLLAISWHRLSFALIPMLGAGLLSAGVMVALNERAHMAGEWIVGGFEAKGVAYALLLISAERWVRGKWNTALAAMGAATAMHVLVGGWGLVALAIAWLLDRSRPRVWEMLPGLAVAGLLAMLGVIPGLQLSAGADSETVGQANVIYVYHRLRHHLLPGSFRPWFIARHLLMLVVWAGLNWGCFAADARVRRMALAVWGAVLIAIAGALLAAVLSPWPTLNAMVLRYYWFRLSDVLLPCGVSLALLWHLTRTREQGSRIAQSWHTPLLIICGLCGLLHLSANMLDRWERPAARSEWRMKNPVDWQAVCRAARDRTPPDARFLIPRLGQTFRWHAERSDVVSWKDIPQDAANVVAWWEKNLDVYALDQRPRLRSLAEQGTGELQTLAQRYHADYLITTVQPQLRLPLIYSNGTYALYQFPREADGNSRLTP